MLKIRTAVVEQRLAGAKDQLEWQDKRSQQEQRRLSLELDGLQKQLAAALSKEGLSLEALALGRDLRNVAEESRRVVQSLVAEMQKTFEDLRKSKTEESLLDNPEWNLVLAQGQMATQQSSTAAALFDNYTMHTRATWDAYFAKAVAHANARGGHGSNIEALRSYGEALALAPDDLDRNVRSRLVGYRGAILKRLGRLAEAESDLLLASKLAVADAERCDAMYNLAGVYALRHDRTKMLECVKAIGGSKIYKNAIASHLHDYFAAYSSDSDLLSLIR
jgi:Flp pilus assembly protein TadD